MRSTYWRLYCRQICYGKHYTCQASTEPTALLDLLRDSSLDGLGLGMTAATEGSLADLAKG